MSLRPSIGRAVPCGRQDAEPPGRRLCASQSAFFAMNAPAKPQDGAGGINLGREEDFALGPARIHPSTCEVEVAGRREIVQPRAMQVLVALARAKGAVVSRDRLIELCWEGRVIGDDAINRAIAKVRAAAELSDPPAFEVETIPRIGFRLRGSGQMVGISGSPTSEKAAQETPPLPSNNRKQHLVLGIAAAAVAAAVLLAFLWRGPTELAEPAE